MLNEEAGESDEAIAFSLLSKYKWDPNFLQREYK